MTENELLELQVQEAQARAKNNRHLDGPPKIISFPHTKVGQVYNIEETYITAYNYVKAETPNKVCTIDLNNTQAQCDYEVFIIIKALLITSIHPDYQFSKVCAAMFKNMISSTSIQTDHGIVITNQVFKEYISNLHPNTYYAKSILQAIRKVAYPGQSLTMYWRQISYCGNEERYIDARNVGERYILHHPEIDSEQTLDVTLATAYKQAKQQEGFLQSFNHRDVPKPLVGMMFLTFLENPQVLKEYQSNLGKDGFM